MDFNKEELEFVLERMLLARKHFEHIVTFCTQTSQIDYMYYQPIGGPSQCETKELAQRHLNTANCALRKIEAHIRSLAK